MLISVLIVCQPYVNNSMWCNIAGLWTKISGLIGSGYIVEHKIRLHAGKKN